MKQGLTLLLTKGLILLALGIFESTTAGASSVTSQAPISTQSELSTKGAKENFAARPRKSKRKRGSWYLCHAQKHSLPSSHFA